MAPKIAAPKRIADGIHHDRELKAKPISYASDFSGLGTTGLALKKLVVDSKAAINLKHIFSCDKLAASKKFIFYSDPPRHFFQDVINRDLSDKLDVGKLDLYSFTAPCQGLSSAGNQAGADDPRTRLALVSVVFIEKWQPKAVISENTYTIATFKKYKAWLDLVVSKISTAGPGYHVEWRVLNSSAYLPQHRPRWYLLAIRNDVRRARPAGVPLWPVPPSYADRPSVKELVVGDLRSKNFQAYPTGNKDHRNNIMTAYTHCGVNPFKVPVIVDYKASPEFSSHRVNESMTLTRTRCSQFGYWCSTKGAPLGISDMMKLQGFYSPAELPWVNAGVKETAIAGMLGNGQTFPLVLDLLPHLLYHSSLITIDQYVKMKKVPKNYRP